MKPNLVLQGAFLEAVENQLQEHNPPETRQTLDRLVGKGISREEAIRLIGAVLAAETYDVLKTKQPYNQKRYIQRLSQLPDLSFLE
jgi:hypothetical protein